MSECKYEYIDVVLTNGPPGLFSPPGLFIEDPDGHSVRVGEWLRKDQWWVLRIPTVPYGPSARYFDLQPGDTFNPREITAQGPKQGDQ